MHYVVSNLFGRVIYTFHWLSVIGRWYGHLFCSSPLRVNQPHFNPLYTLKRSVCRSLVKALTTWCQYYTVYSNHCGVCIVPYLSHGIRQNMTSSHNRIGGKAIPQIVMTSAIFCDLRRVMFLQILDLRRWDDNNEMKVHRKDICTEVQIIHTFL